MAKNRCSPPSYGIPQNQAVRPVPVLILAVALVLAVRLQFSSCSSFFYISSAKSVDTPCDSNQFNRSCSCLHSILAVVVKLVFLTPLSMKTFVGSLGKPLAAFTRSSAVAFAMNEPVLCLRPRPTIQNRTHVGTMEHTEYTEMKN